MKFSNGDKYEGEFVDNIMYGEGTYTWSHNKAIYKGIFNGELEGEGKLIMDEKLIMKEGFFGN